MSSNEKKSKIQVLILVLILVSFVESAIASSGNDMPEYVDCMKLCQFKSCSGNKLIKFETEQNFYMRLLGWSCLEEVIKIFNQNYIQLT